MANKALHDIFNEQLLRGGFDLENPQEDNTQSVEEVNLEEVEKLASDLEAAFGFAKVASTVPEIAEPTAPSFDMKALLLQRIAEVKEITKEASDDAALREDILTKVAQLVPGGEARPEVSQKAKDTIDAWAAMVKAHNSTSERRPLVRSAADWVGGK